MKAVEIKKSSMQQARMLALSVAGKPVSDEQIIEEALRVFIECMNHLMNVPRSACTLDLRFIKKRLQQ